MSDRDQWRTFEFTVRVDSAADDVRMQSGYTVRTKYCRAFDVTSRARHFNRVTPILPSLRRLPCRQRVVISKTAAVLVYGKTLTMLLRRIYSSPASEVVHLVFLLPYSLHQRLVSLAYFLF